MATIVPTLVTRAGVDVAGAAVDAAGDEWVNTGQEFVEITNNNAGTVTVTLDIKATIDGAAAVDPTVSILTTARKIIGPFPKGIYNDSVTGRAKVTCSPSASVLIKVLQCPPG